MVVKRKMIKPGGPTSKFQPNWEGSFVVKEAYPGNAYKLVNADGDELGHPWNGLYLKKFYPKELRIDTVLSPLDGKAKRL